MLGIDHELVEIAVTVDGDETSQRAVLFGDHDRGFRHQLVAPALAPPVHPRSKIDLRIGLLPGAMPEVDRRRFVSVRVGAEVERAHYRSVSFSSMRRLRL